MLVGVTGATGFLGRHVRQDLAHREIESVLVSRRHIDSRELSSNETVIVCDIAEINADIFQQLRQPSVVIHLAWGGLPNYESAHHIARELPSQVNFIGQLLDGGLKSLVVAGTCLEYGLQEGRLTESATSTPTTAYGRAKDDLHKYIENRTDRAQFNLTWARLFYVFGDGQSSNSLYSSLCAALDSGEKEFKMSKGEQIRDFLAVQTVAKTLVDLALLNMDIGVVNVCSGEPVSVNAFVESIIVKKKASINLRRGVVPYPEYEPKSSWGSTAKLTDLLSRSKELG
jgi:dTDP-6-deoxy-L-talose 4-dehydrogenase (NAD+)